MRAILGIDEVGRGPWAGPLVIGAVILPQFPADPARQPAWYQALTDSKQLTPKKRAALAETIFKEAPATGLGWVSARELDATGLADSLKLATRRAVRQVRSTNVPFSEIIIDGTVNFLASTTLEHHVTTLKKADFLIKEVSAASIIAKVARDTYMQELAQLYPGYSFESHVGYGTAAHRTALENLGPTPEHRTSFRPVAKLLDSGTVKPTTPPRVKNTTETGRHAEAIVADYLSSIGHQIVAKNHKTKFYEIDIISLKADKIYFTEVKYRKDPSRGTPLAAITKDKLQKMHFAAEAFLQYTGTKFQPVLAAAAVSGPEFTLEQWLPLD